MTDLPPTPFETAASRLQRHWRWLASAAAVLVLSYYPVGMAVFHQIDDDPDFAPPPQSVQASQSRAVAMAALLVRREVDVHRWTANDPFFQPSWALDNMPNFQQGIVAATSRFVTEMNARTGRDPGASGPDSDLEKAAGLLKYPGTVWMFDPSTSWAPTASAEKQYRLATRWLDLYNDRLAGGEAGFDKGARGLAAMLGQVAGDLEASAADIDIRLAEGDLVDLAADDVFYATKGRLYAYSLLLRELGWDYASVLAERELGGSWRNMLEALQAAAALSPPVVVNASPDAALLPSHLAGQGYAVLRARARLTELADMLAR